MSYTKTSFYVCLSYINSVFIKTYLIYVLICQVVTRAVFFWTFRTTCSLSPPSKCTTFLFVEIPAYNFKHQGWKWIVLMYNYSKPRFCNRVLVYNCKKRFCTILSSKLYPAYTFLASEVIEKNCTLTCTQQSAGRQGFLSFLTL